MITLGRVVGIPLRVDRGWFVVFVLVTSSLAFVYVPRVLPSASTVGQWTWAVGASVSLFASLLAHELTHALAARAYGVRVESITLYLLGGVSQMVEEPPTPRALPALGGGAVLGRRHDGRLRGDLPEAAERIPGYPAWQPSIGERRASDSSGDGSTRASRGSVTGRPSRDER